MLERTPSTPPILIRSDLTSVSVPGCNPIAAFETVNVDWTFLPAAVSTCPGRAISFPGKPVTTRSHDDATGCCYRIVPGIPPSTTMICPVMEVAVTNTMTCAAMSSAWPTRPSTAYRRAPAATASGRRLAMRVSSTSPGATQLTATSGAMATARQRVRWVSPALLEE